MLEKTHTHTSNLERFVRANTSTTTVSTTTIYLFERSEFLIATIHPPPKICACVRLILVLVWGTYYVPDTYVPHFMIPCTHYVPDTYDTRYVLCTRYVCTTLAVVVLIVQLYRYLFIR